VYLINGRPEYRVAGSSNRITWNGTYWLYSDFRGESADFTPINPVQGSLPLVPGEDTDYPFLDLNANLRSEFSNLVFN